MRFASTLLLFAVAALGCAREPASAPPPGTPGVLAALITREERSTRPDGMTITTRYQERLVRQGSRVWVQRVLDPTRVRPADGEGAHGHHHEWSTAPRLVEQLTDGGLDLHLVLDHERQLVGVEPPDRESVGFTESWEDSAQLISTGFREKMQPFSREGAPAGARWLTASTPQGFVRALWSEAHQVALRVEAERSDGSWAQTVSVELEPAPAALPWEALAGFSRRDLNDFRD